MSNNVRLLTFLSCLGMLLKAENPLPLNINVEQLQDVVSPSLTALPAELPITDASYEVASEVADLTHQLDDLFATSSAINQYLNFEDMLKPAIESLPPVQLEMAKAGASVIAGLLTSVFLEILRGSDSSFRSRLSRVAVAAPAFSLVTHKLIAAALEKNMGSDKVFEKIFESWEKNKELIPAKFRGEVEQLYEEYIKQGRKLFLSPGEAQFMLKNFRTKARKARSQLEKVRDAYQKNVEKTVRGISFGMRSKSL